MKTVAYSQIFYHVYMVHVYCMHMGEADIPIFYIQYNYYITVTKTGV